MSVQDNVDSIEAMKAAILDALAALGGQPTFYELETWIGKEFWGDVALRHPLCEKVIFWLLSQAAHDALIELINARQVRLVPCDLGVYRYQGHTLDLPVWERWIMLWKPVYWRPVQVSLNTEECGKSQIAN